MESQYHSFLSFREKSGFKTLNSKIQEVVDSYVFLEASEKNDSELDFNIEQKLKESKIIIISHYKEHEKEKEDLYFVVSFKQTILVINEEQFKILQIFLSRKTKLEICFLSSTKDIFDCINDKFKEAKIKYKEIKNDENFEEEICKINNNFYRTKTQNFPYKNILHIIKSCISGYLIKQSYYTSNRIDKFNDLIKPREIKQNEIIELRTIRKGSESDIVLFYYIEYEKLVVIKKYTSNNTEKEKLLKREIENYKEIKHPFIPNYYGSINDGNLFYPVIEFINGKTLEDTDFSQFSETEIYEIIFQMILVFNYLHNNHFIYRDLKPSNVMIDENKNLVLIDFDRMIKENYIFNENIETADFTSFASPEINSNEMTNKCDIYSIGKIIEFIMNKNKSVMKNTKLFQIYNNCINIKVEIRHETSKLIKDFIKNNFININKVIYYLSSTPNQNYPETHYNLGVIYYEGQYISQDINKAIYYLLLAANQNHPEAQYNIGYLYYDGKYVSRDINKAIYYFLLSASQNFALAQYNIGCIYFDGQYVSRDINKAIYYFLLAANQNHSLAQNNLGVIYEEGKYVSRDINKAIYYYSLAANQNFPQAQFNLGYIYFEGQYVSRDINKAIYYFLLAANQNYPDAQHNLGVIYYEGQYISRDMNKAIYYFSLASNQNYPQSQYNLGVIYEKGQYVSRDINKAIYYYSLAANLNYPNAQNNLGVIYEKGQYVSRDINKAIYYFLPSAKQNYPEAQYNLGYVYFEGQYVSRDINKSIYYFSRAANQNFPQAQFILGLIYHFGINIKKNIKRGIYLISQSSNNGYIQSHFVLGFLYQEGKFIKRNINESIKFYKKASSFNNQYAKNNLGIIYKNYIEKKYDYTIYFEEAIREKNDPVSMYNLSHAYIYEYQDEKLINKSIELLIKSSNLGFKPSTDLLCLTLLKIFFNIQVNGNELINITNIEKEMSKFTEETTTIKYLIINTIQEMKLYDRSIFKYYYKEYEEIEFVYNLLIQPVCIKYLYRGENELKLEDSKEEYNIKADFYEGFGQDINQK